MVTLMTAAPQPQINSLMSLLLSLRTECNGIFPEVMLLILVQLLRTIDTAKRKGIQLF